MYTIYGIRHHGPGSTRSLLRALEDQQPDCLLIEAPQDADTVLEYLLHPDMEPPVAILVYESKQLRKASYLPFAEFSPEWQAAQYGLAQGLEVRFIDLPMSIQFGLREEDQQLKLELSETTEEAPYARDPMGYAARIAGYTDSERWWEATFEQPDNDIDIFEAIRELTSALREELPNREGPLNRMREAFMRKQLRKAIKDGHKNIAVVCGAWHAPALQHLPRFKQTEDNALLKGKKKVKTEATWIPWTYPRLAFQSGYGAGLVSPAYYELLFEKREEAVQQWMSKVARLLRSAGKDASAAQAVDAARLATTLATIRQQTIAGIDEMKEAAIAVFGQGETGALQLIEEQLIIGDRVGKVPGDIPQIPLQADLEKRIRSAYLKKYYQSATEDFKSLDLRKPTNLKASRLLHQLLLLDIPFGQPVEAQEGKLGSFSENWRLKWDPDYIIRLIRAGMWGNTIYTAANRYLLHKADQQESLPGLVQLARSALLAGIREAFGPLVQRLEDSSAQSRDVHGLMEALPLLVDIQRYGDTRQTDVEAVAALIRHLVPRITIGLPPTTLHIEEEVAQGLLQLMISNNRAINLLNEPGFQQDWLRALQQISRAAPAHPLLRGWCSRVLYDKGQIIDAEAARRLHYALSSVDEAEQGVLWLEGFLSGSGLLLLYLPELWRVLDNWVSGLAPQAFQVKLPLIRRAFSAFSGPEREKILQLARYPPTAEGTADEPPATTAAFDQRRAKKVLPTLKLLLGLDD